MTAAETHEPLNQDVVWGRQWAPPRPWDPHLIARLLDIPADIVRLVIAELVGPDQGRAA